MSKKKQKPIPAQRVTHTHAVGAAGRPANAPPPILRLGRRLTAEEVKEAILHPDQQVRNAAVDYFADGAGPLPLAMPIVIKAIERYGFEHAFSGYAFMDDLRQSEETVGWLIKQIQQAAKIEGEIAGVAAKAYGDALIHADAVLLQSHQKEIEELEFLDAVSREAVSERLDYLSKSADELWNKLDEFCQIRVDDEVLEPEDYAFGCRIVEALGRHRDIARKLPPILSGDDDDYNEWIEGFAVRLAGEIKLEQAIPLIWKMLDDSGEWLDEECERALTKIGGDIIVNRFARDCPHGSWNQRLTAAIVLQRVHSDLSVRTSLKLLKSEKEAHTQAELLQAILLNFATDGIDPARQFILERPFDPDVLNVRSALLNLCKLTGERFPEFDAWLEDSKGDQAFRSKWNEDHPLPDDEREEWDEDIEHDLEDDDEFEEQPTMEEFEKAIEEIKATDYLGFEPQPETIVREEPRIGRNDPCPCGSGKKYKKCCLNKG